MNSDKVFGVLFLIVSVFSILEFLIYLKEYFHFRRAGIRKTAKVVASFCGESEKSPLKLPIRSLPIVEFEIDGKKLRLKTFQNQYSPLTTFAFYDREVAILYIPYKNYCMIDWKIIIVIGVMFNTGFLMAFLYLTGIIT